MFPMKIKQSDSYRHIFLKLGNQPTKAGRVYLHQGSNSLPRTPFQPSTRPACPSNRVLLPTETSSKAGNFIRSVAQSPSSIL